MNDLQVSGLTEEERKWLEKRETTRVIRKNPDEKYRECLGCGKKFLSKHKFNRQCLNCRDRDDWSQGTVFEGC